MPDKRGNLKVCLWLEALSKKNHRTGNFILTIFSRSTLPRITGTRMGTMCIPMKKG
jgi:hypothetical protein